MVKKAEGRKQKASKQAFAAFCPPLSAFSLL
jgi:hypothetical protein